MLIHWKTSSSEVSRNIEESDLLPIVSVGNDRKLLELREKVIRGTGLSIQSVTSDEAVDLAHSSDARLWIFCHTVEIGSLVYLAWAIRRHSPNSKLLLLEGPWPDESLAPLFPHVLDATRTVDLLLTTIAELAIRDGRKENPSARFTLPS